MPRTSHPRQPLRALAALALLAHQKLGGGLRDREPGERPGRRESGHGNGFRRHRFHRSREASSTIHLTSSPKSRPAWAANSGTRLVSVIPGCVLTSSQTSVSLSSW